MPELSLRCLVDGSPITRRMVTVPAVAGAAGVLASTAWAWGPAALALDLVRDPGRLPRVRALSMATAWSWLETIGIGMSAALWAAGRGQDIDANYALQRWWALRLLDMMRVFANVRLEVSGLDSLAPGPVVLAPRHASIADALLPVWLLAQHDMRPRYVLKRELLLDPCLDIIGNRVPNHFVVRDADTTEIELAALREMAAGMGPRDGAVIYPEGAIANGPRRTAALARLAQRDPVRAERLTALTRLMPPHHAGLWAVLAGSPAADIVFVDHTGFEVAGQISRAPSQIPFQEPIRVDLRRVPRAEIPTDRGAFKTWLDDAWLELDHHAPPVDERR